RLLTGRQASTNRRPHLQKLPPAVPARRLMTLWQRWIRQPQTVWLRKVIFQVHMWSGIGVGLYVVLVSVTGSVLVWRNELAVAATHDPIIVTGSGPRLTDQQLR